MKKTFTFILFALFALQTFAQDIIVSFSGEILETETPVTLDSINIENLIQIASITILGNASINITTGEIISAIPMITEQLTFHVYPNPFNKSTNIEFYVRDNNIVHIMVSNITGQLIANWNRLLTAGRHNCQFYPENNGIYLITVHIDESTVITKAISFSKGNSKSEIIYQHPLQTETHNTMIKNGNSKDFPFTVGDALKYTGYYTDYATVMVDYPSESKSYTFELVDCMDYDGNKYQVVKLDNHWWMAENLKTNYTTAGDPLNGVNAYDDNENNVEEYGRLYTWESAMNACPEGWHLPNNAEWDELLSTQGSNTADNLREGGTSGFNAKMGGFLSEDSYGYIGKLGLHWTSTEFGDHATQKLIKINEPNVITENISKSCGLSVRCIKD